MFPRVLSKIGSYLNTPGRFYSTSSSSSQVAAIVNSEPTLKHSSSKHSFDAVFEDYQFSWATIEDLPEEESSLRYNRRLKLTPELRLNEEHAKHLIRFELGYTHMSFLGRGAYGSVFRVRTIVDRCKPRQNVACKIITFGLGKTWALSQVEFDSKMVCFAEEARFCTKTNDLVGTQALQHENIRECYKVFQIYYKKDANEVMTVEHGRPLPQDTHQLLAAGLLMELIDGTLADWMSQRQLQTLNEFQAKQVFVQIGNALVYLHQKHQTIHGDLKWDNIGVEKMNDFNSDEHIPQLKLIDFGNSERRTMTLLCQAEEQSQKIKLAPLSLFLSKQKNKRTSFPRFDEFIVPATHLHSENPFLQESYQFACCIIMLLCASCDDYSMDFSFIRERFAKTFRSKDERFKRVLLQMSERNECDRVTVRWAMQQLQSSIDLNNN